MVVSCLIVVQVVLGNKVIVKVGGIFVVRTQYIFYLSHLCVQTSSCGFLWEGPGELDSAM